MLVFFILVLMLIGKEVVLLVGVVVISRYIISMYCEGEINYGCFKLRL